MCGIVGLFIKDPQLEPELGSLLSSMLGVMCGFRRVHLHPAYWVRNGVRGIVAPISRAAPASLGVVMLDRGRRSSA